MTEPSIDLERAKLLANLDNIAVELTQILKKYEETILGTIVLSSKTGQIVVLTNMADQMWQKILRGLAGKETPPVTKVEPT
jgi:hypothetical protein